MAWPVLAERDAAIKAQEGSVDHWIEYYRQQRSGEAAPAAQSSDKPHPPRTGPEARPAPAQPRK